MHFHWHQWKKALTFLINLLKKLLKINYLKFFSYILFVLIFGAFFVHNLLIFNEILNSPLIKSESVEKIMRFQFTDIMICFEAGLDNLGE